MSLSRNFFNDFHPLFRLVEDPQSSYGSPAQQRPTHQQRQAVVEVSEEEKEYVLRAELPGVQKKDMDIHVGNDGRSLTIEGHVHRTNKPNQTQAQDSSTKGGSKPSEDQDGTYEYRSTFSRTVWFPHAVDGNNARANLADGILTLNLPKRMESGRQKINLF